MLSVSGPISARPLAPSAHRRTVFVRHVKAGGRVCAVADWRLLGTCLFLNGIVVDPRERGYGYGSGLLDDGERLALRLGCDRLALDVSSTNLPARRLYERHGFVERTFAEWIDVRPGVASHDPGVRLLDWPSFSAHRSAYGFGDFRVVLGSRDLVVRVVGRAMRAPADEDGSAIVAALSATVVADRAFTVRSTSAAEPTGEAFAHFVRMARALTEDANG